MTTELFRPPSVAETVLQIQALAWRKHGTQSGRSACETPALFLLAKSSIVNGGASYRVLTPSTTISRRARRDEALGSREVSVRRPWPAVAPAPPAGRGRVPCRATRSLNADGSRGTDVVALRDVATHLAKHVADGLSLHALGYHLQTKRVGQQPVTARTIRRSFAALVVC